MSRGLEFPADYDSSPIYGVQSLLDATRLAALAGAAPVACVHPDTLAMMRETPRKWKRIGVEPPCELRTLEGYVNLFTHAPAKAREVTPEMLRAFKSHVYAVMPTAHMPADSHIENALRAALPFAEGE